MQIGRSINVLIVNENTSNKTTQMMWNRLFTSAEPFVKVTYIDIEYEKNGFMLNFHMNSLEIKFYEKLQLSEEIDLFTLILSHIVFLTAYCVRLFHDSSMFICFICSVFVWPFRWIKVDIDRCHKFC